MKILTLATTVLFALGSVSLAEEPADAAPVKIEEAEKTIAGGAQILDVRTLEEWDEGHLEGATRIDVTENGFLDKAKAVLDTEKDLVVYCRSGRRSAIAAEQLREAGYTVHELEGGITAWQSAGKKVVKPQAAPSEEPSEDGL